jgi:hypothetical protein
MSQPITRPPAKRQTAAGAAGGWSGCWQRCVSRLFGLFLLSLRLFPSSSQAPTRVLTHPRGSGNLRIHSRGSVKVQPRDWSSEKRQRETAAKRGGDRDSDSDTNSDSDTDSGTDSDSGRESASDVCMCDDRLYTIATATVIAKESNVLTPPHASVSQSMSVSSDSDIEASKRASLYTIRRGVLTPPHASISQPP